MYPPAKVVTTCLLRLYGQDADMYIRTSDAKTGSRPISEIRSDSVRIAEPGLAIPGGDFGKFWVLLYWNDCVSAGIQLDSCGELLRHTISALGGITEDSWSILFFPLSWVFWTPVSAINRFVGSSLI